MTQIDLFEDFTLLLFIHLARVDGSIHPNERDVILTRMNELFPNKNYWDEKLVEMDKAYIALGHSKAEALLKDNLTKFEQTDPNSRSTMHVAVYDIINANGRVSEEEIRALQVFKGWLTSL